MTGSGVSVKGPNQAEDVAARIIDRANGTGDGVNNLRLQRLLDLYVPRSPGDGYEAVRR